MSQIETKVPAPPGVSALGEDPRSPNYRGAWVQTERKAHEEWARLIARKPSAAIVAHILVANMGTQNAVVISQKTLAAISGLHERTIRRAIEDLIEERWVQVVRLGRGKECAYVVNDQVAWSQKRDNLRLSLFSASVVADADDQDQATLEPIKLRRIPTLYPGEQQLPSGPGLPPPSQPFLNGLEPDLPALGQSASPPSAQV